MKIIISTKINPAIGRKTEIIDVIKAAPVSIVETTGLATPAVVVVDASLVAPDVPEITAAVPPPAMIANAQVISGLKLATVDTITAVPATAAKGTATESSRLSTNGIKYAKISTKVATPKITNAVVLPIHCQLSLSSQTLK